MRTQRERSAVLSLEVSDVTGQRVIQKDDISPDMTVGELVRSLLAEMQLPDNVSYQLRLDREGRHVNYSERVSDAFQTRDRVMLQPNIDAGK